MKSGPTGIDDQISSIRSRFFDESGAGGVEQELSGLADRAVARAWASEPARTWTALAVGGYGRRVLHPMSDLDIVFFSRTRRPESGWVDSMLGRLADIPFPAEGDAVIEADFSTFDPERAFIYGAYLDARYLFGTVDLARSFIDGVIVSFVERNRARLIEALIAQRKAQVGESGDLKNGRGGLADYRWIQWIRRVADHPVLTPAEVRSAEEASRFLRSVRTGLHWIAGRKQDVLLPVYALDVAHALGFAAPGSGDASHLVDACGTACRTIGRIAATVTARVRADRSA